MVSGSFRSILCPVDFSEHSIEALRFAIGLAGRDQARLTVLTVNEPLLVEAATAKCGGKYLERETVREQTNLVLELMPGTADWAPVPHSAVRAGKPHSEILKCAAEEEADLIVMGTHGLGDYQRKFLGSVTERVLRHSPIPVLVVPPLARDLVIFADREPIFHVGHVLAPVDFGLGTARQVRVAEDFACAFAAPLLLVHVLSELRGPAGLRFALRGRDRERNTEARERLSELATSTADQVETCLVCGKPADEIAGIAARHRVGLIVIGLSGEGANDSRPGSVAYRVLTMTSVPVLALPPSQEEVAATAEHVTRNDFRTGAVGLTCPSAS